MLFALGFIAGVTTSLLCVVLEIALFYRFSREGKGFLGSVANKVAPTKPGIIEPDTSKDVADKLKKIIGI